MTSIHGMYKLYSEHIKLAVQLQYSVILEIQTKAYSSGLRIKRCKKEPKNALKRWNMIRDNINGKAKTAKQWKNVKTNIIDRSLKKLVTLDKIKQFKTKRQSAMFNESIDDVRASAEMESSRDLEKVKSD
mmetsp:Transcript_1575/g.3536  ORF Transcript_1575/g.3536 Transcript_1575/m.3536 type:complete len:130 (-) Transcript_1575:365-754(-)